jgi:hypothetical protein
MFKNMFRNFSVLYTFNILRLLVRIVKNIWNVVILYSWIFVPVCGLELTSSDNKLLIWRNLFKVEGEMLKFWKRVTKNAWGKFVISVTECSFRTCYNSCYGKAAKRFSNYGAVIIRVHVSIIALLWWCL